MKDLKFRLEYYFVLLFEKFIMLLPRAFRKKLFLAFGNLLYILPHKNKEVIKKNLLYVYDGNISDQKIKKIQKACYQKLFLNILSIIENEYLTKEDIKKIVTFKNIEFFEKLSNDNKPFIYITAHFGNMELLGASVGKVLGKMVQVQQKLNNPYLSKYLEQKRQKYNLEIVEKHGAIKKLFLALKKGKNVSLIIDQNVNPKYAELIKFLNKPAYQTTSTSMLAKKLGIPILPVFIISKDKNENSYEIIFKEPIYPKDLSIKELTQLQADVLTKMILEYPQEWFWCHKRFKNSNPNLYKN